jgi:hypothetical protein
VVFALKSRILVICPNALRDEAPALAPPGSDFHGDVSTAPAGAGSSLCDTDWYAVSGETVRGREAADLYQGRGLMPVQLLSLDGHGNIPLDLVLVVVGRHPDSDALLDSSRVSRRHCCLVVDRGGVLVRDLDSRNGTRINGRRIRVGLIRRGDELSIAHLRYRLQIDEETIEAVPTTIRDDCGLDASRCRDLPVPPRPEGDSQTRR